MKLARGFGLTFVILVLSWLGMSAAVAAAPAYHVVELGMGTPIDVNSSGTVVGFDGASAGPQPWIIADGKRTYLPLPADPVKQTYAMVTRVSESGVVVGHVSGKPLMWRPDASGAYKVEWIPLPDGATGGLPAAVVDGRTGPLVLLNFGTPSFLTSPTFVQISNPLPYLYGPFDGLIDLVRRYRLDAAVYVSDMTESGRILTGGGAILEPDLSVTPAPAPRTLSWNGFFATRLNENGAFVAFATLATADGHAEIARYWPGRGWFVIETFIGGMYAYSADGISEAGDALSSQYASHMLTTADGQRLPLGGLLIEPGYALTAAAGGAMANDGRIVIVARNPAGASTAVRLDPAGAYPPPAPVVLSGVAHPATATAPWNAISLTWTASPTASAYVVQRKGPTDTAFVALTPASGTIQTKYDDTAVAPSTSYTYRVLPLGLGGTGAPSNEVTVLSPAATTTTTTPVADTTVVAAPVADTTAPSVTVTTPVNNATVSGIVKVTASARDNVGVARMQVLDGAGRILASVDGASIAYSWNTAGLTKRQTLTVRAFDAAGNVGSKAVTVRIR